MTLRARKKKKQVCAVRACSDEIQLSLLFWIVRQLKEFTLLNATWRIRKLCSNESVVCQLSPDLFFSSRSISHIGFAGAKFLAAC